MRVGIDKIPGEKPRLFTYKDVIYDFDGWADAKKYQPKKFDLVYVKIKGKPTTNGWFSSNFWDGLLVKPEDEVLYWKRKLDS